MVRKNTKSKVFFYRQKSKIETEEFIRRPFLREKCTDITKNKSRAFGELGHPDGPTVNLDRVSHMVTKLYPDGKNFMGEAKIMDTPMGRIVKSLIDEGAQLGVSSRGMGTLEQRNGANYVKNDFYLATAADIVADPSAPDAFVEGIMEGKEWVWDNGLLKEQDIDALKQEMIRARRGELAEAKASVFKTFLEKL